MNAHGIEWPDTGRKIPAGATTEVHNMHESWLDLVYMDERRDVWVYISTIPKNHGKNCIIP